MTIRRPLLSVALLVSSVIAFSAVAFSQIEQGGQTAMTPRGATTNYHFAEPNELTIVVSVIGAVRNPGRYEISRSIDLLNLLALAGGTLDNADLGDVRLYRDVDMAGRMERREFRLNLKDLSEFQGEPFVMQQGDFVSIGRSTSVTAQEVLTYLSTAAILTVAVITIVQATGPSGRLR